MAFYIGLDLGGTNVKVGVVSDKKKVLSKLSVPTPAQDGPEAVMAVMADAAQQAAREAGLAMSKIAMIGIGSPGPMDMKRGIVLATPNMKGWRNVPLRDRIKQLTGRPSVLENDANAAAFGEFWAGAGRDPKIRDLVMLTLGTGIGSGIVIDGKLVHGAHGLGGEAGHMLVVPNGRLCGCGQHGCIEAYASANSMVKITIERILSGEKSSLRDLLEDGDDSTKVDSRAVFKAAKQGDELSKKMVSNTAELLAIACVSLCRILDPQMIVFAGGMTLAGDQLFKPIRKSFAEHTWKVIPSPVEIVPAELGNDAGFIGAAAVAWDAQQAKKA